MKVDHLQAGSSDAYARLLGLPEAPHARQEDFLPTTKLFVSKFANAEEFLLKMVPQSAVEYGFFRVFNLRTIESNLVDFEWSSDFMELGFLPFADYQDDKICCFDCVNITYQVLEWVGNPRIEPFRRCLVLRTRSFLEFMEYMKWRTER